MVKELGTPTRSAANVQRDCALLLVIPAQAGIQISATHGWMPAFAGMTGDRVSLRRKAALSLSTGARFATGRIGFWVGIAQDAKTAK